MNHLGPIILTVAFLLFLSSCKIKSNLLSRQAMSTVEGGKSVSSSAMEQSGASMRSRSSVCSSSEPINKTKTSSYLSSVGSTSNQIKNSSPVGDSLNQIRNLLILSEPDKIIYYHDGKQTFFTKGSQKYSKIIQLNLQRNLKTVKPLKSAVQLDGIEEKVLLYDYSQSGHGKVYFLLDNEQSDQYVLAYASKTNASVAPEYGFLSSPNQLIDFLDS